MFAVESSMVAFSPPRCNAYFVKVVLQVNKFCVE